MSWRPALALLGGLGLLAAAAIFVLTPRYGAEIPSQVAHQRAADGALGARHRFAFPLLLSIGMLDSATRLGVLLFLPFVLRAKGASLPTVGLALTLVFAGGAAGKLICAFVGARIGAVATVWLTEGLTAVGIVALLPLALAPALVLLPVIGIALNGTSSVPYGSVPHLVASPRPARAERVLHRHHRCGRAGARALRRGRRCARRADGVDRRRRDRAAHASALAPAQPGAGAALALGRVVSPSSDPTRRDDCTRNSLLRRWAAGEAPRGATRRSDDENHDATAAAMLTAAPLLAGTAKADAVRLAQADIHVRIGPRGCGDR